MARFRDEHVVAANDAPRFAQDDFHGAGIFLQLSSEREGLRRRLYSGEAHEGTFCFRNNFLSHDEDVAVFEAASVTGKTDGDGLINAMKGMTWESPRGQISIDPETRDIVQNVYIGKVEKVQGELYNVEFETFKAVKDPLKMKK